MRVLAIFCAAFAAGVALSQYLLSAQWALILCGVFAAAALVMGLCGCANKRGDWAKRAFLCALGLCFAFGYNTLYAHFIKAPNDALLGTQDTVEVELLGYAEETSHGAKVTVKILNRGLPGRAIYYGDAELLDLEPGAHVTAEALFNSATDPTGKGLHLRNFTAKGIYILLYQRGDPTYDDTNAGALKYLPQRIARTLGETIERSYSEREGAFLRALLLGDKKYLDEEDASNLSEVGLSHVMAVSGLHCCFLASLIGSLMGDRRKKLRCAVTIPLIFLYAFVTGLTPSILRACIMISMGMIAPLLGRDNVQPALFIVQDIDLCRGEERQDGKPHRRKITVLPALCQRAGDEDRVHVRKPCDGKRGVEIDGVERKLLQKSCDGKHRANAERRHKGTGRAELRHSRRDQYRK